MIVINCFFLLPLLFIQVTQISVGHIKVEVLHVFIEGHDLLLWVGIAKAK